MIFLHSKRNPQYVVARRFLFFAGSNLLILPEIASSERESALLATI